MLHLSKRHCERGLQAASQHGSPSLWLKLVHRWAFANTCLLACGEVMDDSAILVLGDKILSLINFAHATGDVAILMAGAQLASQLSAHIYEHRRCALANVARGQVSVFKDLLKIYRYAPIGSYLDIWAAQAEFIVGDLADDLEIASNARQWAGRAANGIGRHESGSLPVEVKEVLQDLDNKFAALLQRLHK